MYAHPVIVQADPQLSLFMLLLLPLQSQVGALAGLREVSLTTSGPVAYANDKSTAVTSINSPQTMIVHKACRTVPTPFMLAEALLLLLPLLNEFEELEPRSTCIRVPIVL